MKTTKVLLMLIFIISLTSCWDMREIDELGLVMAVAIDKAENPSNYIISVQLANSQNKGTSESGSSSGTASEPTIVLTAEGKTLFEATRELSKTSSKRIMWAHNYIVIIGESLAKDSILPVIDFYTHNSESRMKTAIVVAKGNARDYISSKVPLNEISGVSLTSIYHYNNLTAQYLETDLLKVNQSYLDEYSQPIISLINFKKGQIPSSQGISQQPADTVEFEGSVVFNKDKMAGILTGEETRGIAWVLNNTGITIVTVDEPEQANRSVSVETENVKSEVITSVNNGKPSIKIKVSGKGRIVEEDGVTSLNIDDYKKAIQNKVNAKITQEINNGVNKVQKEFKCDVFGWSRIVHNQNNELWESDLKYKWVKLFPEMPVVVDVNINIYSSTLYQIPESGVKKAGEEK